MNRAAEKAKGDTLIFLSDDVKISGNFLPLIWKILEEDPTALVGGEVVWWPGGWNEFEIEGKKVVVPYANGWLLACKKSTWVESGGFDPIYEKFDYEDLDLSTRWHEMGYNIKAINSPMVRHIGGATISNVGREQITQQHRQIYIAKWYDRLLKLNLGEKA
jgi:GT2 family glycosyltransferase